MQLLAAWKDSLSLIYPLQNLKLFGLAIARAVQIAVPQFFKSFWWLFLVYLPIDVLTSTIPRVVFLGYSWLIFSLIPIVIYLVVRPSVGQKGLFYWQSYGRHILVWLFFRLVLTLISYGFMESMEMLVDSFGENLTSIVFFIGKGFSTIFYWLMPLCCFFFFDSRGSLREFFVSWQRTFLMAFSTMPAWVCLFVTFKLFVKVLAMMSRTIVFGWITLIVVAFMLGAGTFWVSIFMTFITILGKLLGACIWSVFYTHFLHKHVELYFPAPQARE